MDVDHLLFETAAIVGCTEMTMQAFLEVQIGDILLLDKQVQDPLVIKVGEKNCFHGRAGLSETQKAVRIDERIHQ